MNADESMKGLMTKTLNLMIEAEFQAKIGDKKSEQTPARKRSEDGTKIYRCGYRTRRFDTTCGTTSSKKEALRRENKIYKKYNDKYFKAMIRLK